MPPGEEAADVLRVTAESGRNYLYFSPADFEQPEKQRSLQVTESARWLSNTLYKHLDLSRHRVRVDAHPGYVEVGISGALSEVKLEAITATMFRLREDHEDLSPIKLICRLEREQGPSAGTTAADVSPARPNANRAAEAPIPDTGADVPEGPKQRGGGYDFPL